MGDHVRYFEIAGITIQVESDLPITDTTFQPKFEKFRVEGPGDDTVVIRHHFGIPEVIPRCGDLSSAKEVYRKPPWVIYRSGALWVYKCVSALAEDGRPAQVAVFDSNHSSGDIFNGASYRDAWLTGQLHSLTMFATDQVLVGRLLADRHGCILHSAGLTIDGSGFIFVGHSDAGKSTTVGLVRDRLGSDLTILCDDRNVIRYWRDGFRDGLPGFYVHGTWSHGDVPDVSQSCAPLRAVLVLRQHQLNELTRIDDGMQVWRSLLATLIRPMVTAEWWNRQLDVLEKLADEVPFYRMDFDTSGTIVEKLKDLAR